MSERVVDIPILFSSHTVESLYIGQLIDMNAGGILILFNTCSVLWVPVCPLPQKPDLEGHNRAASAITYPRHTKQKRHG